MNFNIREATANDAESICQLLVQGGELHAQALPNLLHPPDSSTTLGFVRSTLLDEDAHILLAESDGRVIGFVHFNRVEHINHPIKIARTSISICSLMVQEERRRRGIGHALMREVHEWAGQHDIHDIELQVYEFNEPARDFYEKLGYTTISRRMARSTRMA